MTYSTRLHLPSGLFIRALFCPRKVPNRQLAIIKGAIIIPKIVSVGGHWCILCLNTVSPCITIACD